MRPVWLLFLVLLLAGCAASTRSSTVSWNMSSTLSHDFSVADGDDAETFSTSSGGNVTLDVAFRGVGVSDTGVCPRQEQSIRVVVERPDGQTDTFTPDIRGVSGAGCGGRSATYPNGAGGTWAIRYSGEGPFSVFIGVSGRGP